MTDKLIDFTSRHRIFGTWANDPENPSVEWDVYPVGTDVDVAGIDAEDGEKFEVSHVTFDGTVLRFRAVMPSTGHVTEHELRLLDDGRAEHRVTLIEQLHRL